EIFGREIAPSGTSWSPGTTGPAGGRPGVSPLVRQVAFTLPKSAVTISLTIEGRTSTVDVALKGGYRGGERTPSEAMNIPAAAGERVKVPLVRLAYARSGDKGDISNIGVIARRPQLLPVLLDQLTPERVKAYFAHLVKGPVERHLL